MARIEQTRPGQQSRLEPGSELIEIGTDGLLHRKKERSKKQVLPFQCEGGNAEDAAGVLFGFHAEAPFGGFKQSGIGRDLGMAAMEGYTELKNVYVAED